MLGSLYRVGPMSDFTRPDDADFRHDDEHVRGVS
jgi:hypothetical protein